MKQPQCLVNIWPTPQLRNLIAHSHCCLQLLPESHFPGLNSPGVASNQHSPTCWPAHTQNTALHPSGDGPIVDNFFVNILSTPCQPLWQLPQSLCTPSTTPEWESADYILSPFGKPPTARQDSKRLVRDSAIVDNFLSTSCQHLVNKCCPGRC